MQTGTNLNGLKQGDPTYTEEIQTRFQTLEEYGFSSKQVARIAGKDHYNTLVKPEHLANTWDLLSKLEVPEENIREQISFYPEILSTPPEIKNERIQNAQEKGMDVKKAISRDLSWIGVTTETFNSVYGCLLELGFENPINLMEKCPSLTKLSPKTIAERVQWFTDNGFESPHALIEKHLILIKYSPEGNLQIKMKVMSRLMQLYQLNITVQDVIEYTPAIVGYKTEKFIILARVLREVYNQNTAITKSVISSFFIKNIETVLLTLFNGNTNNDPVRFHRNLRKLQRRNIPKEVKREQLLEIFKKDPQNSLLRSYFAAYPMKTEQTI